MMGYYQEIGSVALPSAFLLAKLRAPWFEWAFQIAVLLTLVDTGVPILHAINERVAKVYEERQRLMPRALRPALAVGIMVLSVFAASAVGLVGLIATGYGLLTYAFIVAAGRAGADGRASGGSKARPGAGSTPYFAAAGLKSRSW